MLALLSECELMQEDLASSVYLTVEHVCGVNSSSTGFIRLFDNGLCGPQYKAGFNKVSGQFIFLYWGGLEISNAVLRSDWQSQDPSSHRPRPQLTDDDVRHRSIIHHQGTIFRGEWASSWRSEFSRGTTT